MNNCIMKTSKKVISEVAESARDLQRLYVTNLTRDFQLTTNGEVNSGKSMTVPDQAVPLSELVVRYAKGEEVPEYIPSYQDEDDDNVYPDLRQMDMADRQAFMEDVSSQVEYHKDTIRKQRAERKTTAPKESQATKAEVVSEPAEPASKDAHDSSLDS